VGPRAGFDAVAKRKIPSPCRGSKLDRSDRSLAKKNYLEIICSFSNLILNWSWPHCRISEANSKKFVLQNVAPGYIGRLEDSVTN
jgi:hypothetical protein